MKDIEEFLEAIGRAIVKFFKWVYSNIVWLVAVTMLANIIIFFIMKDVFASIWAVWNLIVLITMGIRFWETRQ
jgi:hypothetical protein